MGNYKLSIEAKADLIRIHRRGIRENYRRSVCGVDSIYYRIDESEVEIMAIIGRQETEEWL